MKTTIKLLLATLFLAACSNSAETAQAPQENETFTPQEIQGKWTTDLATAQELKGLHYTIENFTLLNKKKFENSKAYQEFGNLLQMHIERINTYNHLPEKAQHLLHNKLEKLKSEIETLRDGNVEKSQQALKNIHRHFSEIDSTFIYMN